MMTVTVVTRGLPVALSPAVDALVASLRAHPSFAAAVATSLADSTPSDVYMLCGADVQVLATELADVSVRSPARLPRVVLVGAAHGFLRGSQDYAPGGAAELMERYRLGGAFAPEALTSWREAPSWFAGPKELMPFLASNAFKAFQSENYALWFSAPGATLAEFLSRYVPVLSAHHAELAST